MLSRHGAGDHGLVSGNGPVLRTGAAGGVGFGCQFAISLPIWGYLRVAAGEPGRPDTAVTCEISPARKARSYARERAERNRQSARLEAETGRGCIFSVGGRDAGAGYWPE